MNLLRILDEARRRLGLNHIKAWSTPAADHRKPCSDPDLADRIRHGLKRPMNRRELFRFTAIAAAVGTPAVRDLILSPAKTIVVPPAEMFRVPLERYAGGDYRTFSTAETLSAQLELVREKLPTAYDRCEQLARLINPHLQEIFDAQYGDLGYDPNAPYRRILTPEAPDVPLVRVATDFPVREASPDDYFDDWDDWPDEVEEA